MRILGSKFLGHDSAIALIDTKTKTLFAMSTERATRIKHDGFDISPVLDLYNINNLDYVCHSFSNFDNTNSFIETRAKDVYDIKIERSMRNIIKPKYRKDLSLSKSEKSNKRLKAVFSNFSDVINYYKFKIKRTLLANNEESNKQTFTDYINEIISKTNRKEFNINYYEHHLCHAVAAYYFSSFQDSESVISLTIDGKGDDYFSKTFTFESGDYNLVGEGCAVQFSIGKDKFVTSIGDIYGNFTQAMDLHRNSDEGKVEALAAFGKPDENLIKQIKEATIIDKENLSINYDIEKIKPFYNMDWLKEQRSKVGDENFCAVVQRYLEDTMVEYLNAIYEKYPTQNLCLSGGVAANIIMSLNIYERTSFKNIYVLPPMGDEGTAIGSAILQALELGEDVSWLKEHYMPYFGDEYSKEEVEKALKTFTNITYEDLGEDWPKEAAKSVADGKICALFHGKMEFGPRALGNRSIIANPMLNDVRDRINSTVKRRPSYQPFCPSILEEERERLFGLENSFPHKHMAIAFRMKEEFIKDLPCAVHVDGTARPQFVEEKDNPNYYRYLKELKNITGYGISINTSFNLHGRTIVRTPEDAVVDFIDCNIDELFIEGFRVKRK